MLLNHSRNCESSSAFGAQFEKHQKYRRDKSLYSLKFNKQTFPHLCHFDRYRNLLDYLNRLVSRLAGYLEYIISIS